MLFAHIVSDAFLVMSILLFCLIIFRFKERKNAYNGLKLLLIVLYMISLSIGVYLFDNLAIECMVYILSVCVMLYSFYDEKLTTIIISTVWIVVIMGMLDTMSTVLMDMICKVIGNINEGFSRIIGALILYAFVLIISKLYYKKQNKGIRTLGIGDLIAFTVLSIIDTFIVMVIALITRIEERVTDQMIYFVAFILVILGLFLQLGAVILTLMQRNVYKEGQQITEKYLEEQKGHYQYLEQRETETKKFRHDLRDHMGLLSVMAKEHKYDEFDKYVDKINIKIDSFGNNVTVQNGIVDAIINKYYSEAVANGVNMEVKGRFPSDCEIDAYDLCTIFSNVLSNALEATVESKDRWMSVDCRYTEDNIIIVVKNSFDNTNQLRTGKARTYKKDINNHGFGLENVRDSIKKYNGMLDIDIHENIYSITISFNYDRLEGKYEDSNN